MAVTQKAIADRLGVSRQLVTFALNGGGTVSEHRRREILEAAQEMGYQRNELARAMVTGKSRILGVLTYDESIEHIATIIAGVLEETVKAGYAVKVLHIPFDDAPDEVRSIADRCTAWQLDGVVAVGLKLESLDVLAEQLEDRCPLAYVEISHAGRDEVVVRTDDRSAFRAAIEHLAALGHRRIVHLCGPGEHPLTRARNTVFLDVLREFGLPVEPDSLMATHPSSWMDRASVERATHTLLDRPQCPTAIICAGDAAAMIVMRTARRRGVPVPEALSVIGFGNFGLSEHADPPLTSIGQPFREMGRRTMQRLLEQMTAERSATVARGSEELPAHLVVRESTAPAP